MDFPSELQIPVTKRHRDLRSLLFSFLKHNFERVAHIGCNQFVYWDSRDPNSWVSPDGFVCFRGRDEEFDNWKVWERGIPQVAIEISHPMNDGMGWVSPEPSWEHKLRGYLEIGVRELVRFEPDARERPLRAWDRVGEGLAERELERPCVYSRSLRGYWVLVEDEQSHLTLRLSRDPNGTRLYPTPSEGSSFFVEFAEERASEMSAELQRRASR